jgi:hypothetical protein
MKEMHFECLWCSPPQWIPVKDYNNHYFLHARFGDDVGAMQMPNSWENYQRRCGALGMLEIKEIEIPEED